MVRLPRDLDERPLRERLGTDIKPDHIGPIDLDPMLLGVAQEVEQLSDQPVEAPSFSPGRSGATRNVSGSSCRTF